ncbi:metallophosphoesterase family protein [Altererythrobacter aquiaggeris]|uniref:metallophosphoesterase family protein n=1 Tax=Aestuarierythrobacter aquiaggeris TaxID=1898396 RepID=UPI00301A4028
MFKPVKDMLRKKRRPVASIPEGHRVYAIGDIHGRLDLLDALIDAVEDDDASAGKAISTVILLGDLVDRGPDSAGVIARARDWQQQRNVRILAGNHEEMFLGALEKKETLRQFIRHGGRETILSYGVKKKDYNSASMEELLTIYRDAVPEADIAFLKGFEELIVIGDYLFVHAGIAPDVAPNAQKRKDMLWIREPFLSYREPHSHVVVHGHTISDKVEDCGNRIGIDTGAYCNGRLTALVLEGSTRRYLTARDDVAGIKIKQKAFG